jgi:hypothetical protein
MCLNDAVLLCILASICAPVQTRVVLRLAVPALGEIDLAVGRPLERVGGQHPVGRPDARGRGRQTRRRQVPARSRQSLVRRQTRRRVAAVLHQRAHNQTASVVERVRGRVRVHLLLPVAPAVVAELVAEVVRYGCRGIEGGLPVDAGRRWLRCWRAVLGDRRRRLRRARLARRWNGRREGLLLGRSAPLLLGRSAPLLLGRSAPLLLRRSAPLLLRRRMLGRMRLGGTLGEFRLPLCQQPVECAWHVGQWRAMGVISGGTRLPQAELP